MRIKYQYYCVLLAICCSLAACHSNSPEKEADDAVVATQTPVTVTSVSNQPLEEYIELNATSVFLQKSYVKAIASGYIQSVTATLGQYVAAGAPLFIVKTKEAQSIGNTISKLDPSLKFSGQNSIKASSSGYIIQLNHQQGDYVQDGEQLAVISDASSFAFLLELPYELKQSINGKKTVRLTLPDSTVIIGVITATMPAVDPVSQTQSIIIKIRPAYHIPENLIAKVSILKSQNAVVSLPKAAVLTNDVQSEFWVMKMTDSNTAVKVSVQKGIETKDRVQIIQPIFNVSDKILLTGNFGLPDTAKVKIVQE